MFRLSIVSLFALAVLATSASVADTTLEPSVRRMGGTYRSIELDPNQVEKCRATCEAEAACLSFTLFQNVAPNSPAYCHLKTSVPYPVVDSCCVSGVKYYVIDPSVVAKQKTVPPDGLQPIDSLPEGIVTVPREDLTATPPLPTPAVTGLSPARHNSGHMNAKQTLTIIGTGFLPTPGKNMVGLRTYDAKPEIPPRTPDFVAELPVKSATATTLTATLPASVAPGNYLAWVFTEGGGHSNVVPLTVVAPRTVRIEKIEQNKCRTSVRFHLDRSGGFWKGKTVLRLDGYANSIDSGQMVGPALTITTSHSLYGRLNIPVKPSVLDPTEVPGTLYGGASVSFPKFPPLHIAGVSPDHAKAGQSTALTLSFGNYDLGDGPVNLTIEPSQGTTLTQGKSYNAKVGNWAQGGKVEATIAATSSASAGPRKLRLSAECYESDTKTFTILSATPPPPPPATVSTANVSYSKHVPYQGQFAYKAIVNIPNAKLQSVGNPNLGLGKQWMVRLPKSPKVGSEDCNKPDKDFVNLKPGQNTSAFKGLSLFNFYSWICLVPLSNYTLQQGYPTTWTLKLTYTK